MRNGRVTRGRVLAAVATGAAMLAFPAAAMAVSFGADLDSNLQPSGAGNGHFCEGGPTNCTWVLMDAYQNAGGERAPKDGKIRKIKIIANDGGSFRFQVAKAKADQQKARIVENGPKISYDGQPDPNEPYVIERFDVNVPVKEGEYLAIKAKRPSLLRCSSGGPNVLQFQPPLALGGPFENATSDDGCWLLLEAVIR